jgi:Protein of unknown function (DUF1273).
MDEQIFRVGITGHRDLSGFDAIILFEQIATELMQLKEARGHVQLICSIAEGADQLCAQIGLALGYELICPLPFQLYREDFSGDALEIYDSLLQQAINSFIVADGMDRNAAYLSAGKYVVDHSDVLIAVWDGLPQQSSCGTAKIVVYANECGVETHIIGLSRLI